MDKEMSAELVKDLEQCESILKKLLADCDADDVGDALNTALASVQAHLRSERKVLAAIQDDVEPMNDNAEDDADAIVARAPTMACTYLLRASTARPGCIEFSVEGHGEWTAYPLEYYQSRDKASPFAQMWKCAGAADRRRLVAEVRAAADEPRFVVIDVLDPEDEPRDAVRGTFNSREEADEAAVDMARVFEDNSRFVVSELRT